MSADNFIAIIKQPDGTFIGYNCCASQDYKTNSDYEKFSFEQFRANTIEEAIVAAQDVFPCEYGYTFINLSLPIEE